MILWGDSYPALKMSQHYICNYYLICHMVWLSKVADYLRRVSGMRHLRLVRVAADARLADLHVEHAEVAQFHFVALGERFGDLVEGFLHHVEDLGLDQPGFLADAHHDVSVGQGHRLWFVEVLIWLRAANTLPPEDSWAGRNNRAKNETSHPAKPFCQP